MRFAAMVYAVGDRSRRVGAAPRHRPREKCDSERRARDVVPGDDLNAYSILGNGLPEVARLVAFARTQTR